MNNTMRKGDEGCAIEEHSWNPGERGKMEDYLGVWAKRALINYTQGSPLPESSRVRCPI